MGWLGYDILVVVVQGAVEGVSEIFAIHVVNPGHPIPGIGIVLSVFYLAKERVESPI